MRKLRPAMRWCAAAVIGLAGLLAGRESVGQTDPVPTTVAAVEPGGTVFTFDSDAGLSGWTSDTPQAVAAVPGTEVDRTGTVARVAMNGRAATLRLQRATDMSPYRAIRFDVLLPATAAHTHVAAYFVDGTDFWYQTWRRVTPAQGRWETVEIDLRPESGEFEPVNHSRPWGPYVARTVSEVGLRIFADRDVQGPVYFDNVHFVPASAQRVEQSIYNFETSGDAVRLNEKFEITFELARTYANPFDPTEVDVRAELHAPSGATINVPAFFFQNYNRRVDERAERLVPAGSPKWKVRFAPREIGAYTYEIVVVDSETTRLPMRGFASLPSDNPGFLRVSTKDHRYFEFDNGEFFYPIGQNIPATYNRKGAEALGVLLPQKEGQIVNEGTLAYDRFIAGMKRGGENYARVWLGCWSFGLEWTKRYERAYAGLGRYNQENAWRLDHVMDQCHDAGVYVQLALTTFGHFRATRASDEGDWDYSPYSISNGGPLRNPQDFWSNARAQEIYQRMVRYVMARWGYCTNIAAWEVCNEADLVTGFNASSPTTGVHAALIEWHKQCARTVKAFDPNTHMITTSFSQSPKNFELMALPEISFTSTHMYGTDIIKLLRETVWPVKSALNKPAILGEVGYHWTGALPETTERYLHICLWSSYMMPFAGSGLSWWWDFIEDRNLYERFKPLADYAAGEDRRARGLEMSEGIPRDAAGNQVGTLGLLTLQNDSGGYFWLYERQLIRAESASAFVPAPREKLAIEIKGLKPDDYVVEFWDTHKGGRLLEVPAQVQDGLLRCAVPTFTSDIAGKIKPAASASAEPAAPVGTPAAS